MIAVAVIALGVLGLVALYKIFSRQPVCKGGKTPGRWLVKPSIDHVMAASGSSDGQLGHHNCPEVLNQQCS